MTNPIEIEDFILMGDSLSDRQGANKRYILGIIPMRWFTGLDGNSPLGRFTNGLAWSDHFCTKIADERIIEQLKRKGMDGCDIADAVIAKDRRLKHTIQDSYFLDNHLYVKYNGQLLARTYDEGGLTAHDYSWAPSSSIVRFFSRIILTTLAAMRNQLLSYDKEYEVPLAKKAKTLVIEWSGANDLITVNKEASRLEADKAVADRIQNVKQLKKNGYKNFVLFNLPDLSLTPRYQALSAVEQQNAHACSLYFNEQLAAECAKLKQTFPDCSIEVFDVNKMFTDVYNHPENYGFDKEKLTTPFIKSNNFTKIANKISPATGYMFWDDLHPTADMHAKLADIFYQTYAENYKLVIPEVKKVRPPLRIAVDELREDFRKEFMIRRQQESNVVSKSKDKLNIKTASLEGIFTYALKHKESRTYRVLRDLHWIDAKDELLLKIPALVTAQQVAMNKINPMPAHSQLAAAH